MSSMNTNSILLVFIILGVATYFIIKLFSKDKKLKTPKTIPVDSSSQDFSAFGRGNDFSEEAAEDLEEEEQIDQSILKGDMSKLEEFVDALIKLPKDTLSDIQISKSEEDDLLVSIQKDEELGLIIESFYPEEETSLSYSEWLNSTKQVIESFRLQIDNFSEKDESIRAIIEGKIPKEVKEITERFLSQGFVNKVGNTFLVEYYY